MCLTLGAALTACDFGTTDPGHTHTYETAWSHDDTYHWYACGNETCSDISQKAEHLKAVSVSITINVVAEKDELTIVKNQ